MKNTVRARREELRMTQEELAERSGVSRTTISALGQHRTEKYGKAARKVVN